MLELIYSQHKTYFHYLLTNTKLTYNTKLENEMHPKNAQEVECGVLPLCLRSRLMTFKNMRVKLIINLTTLLDKF